MRRIIPSSSPKTIRAYCHKCRGVSSSRIRESIRADLYQRESMCKSFLGCSGPLDNARTIPEWLKNSFNKFAKKLLFYIKIGQSCNLCSTNNL